VGFRDIGYLGQYAVSVDSKEKAAILAALLGGRS